jgi:hypothetical protein
MREMGEGFGGRQKQRQPQDAFGFAQARLFSLLRMTAQKQEQTAGP